MVCDNKSYYCCCYNICPYPALCYCVCCALILCLFFRCLRHVEVSSILTSYFFGRRALLSFVNFSRIALYVDYNLVFFYNVRCVISLNFYFAEADRVGMDCSCENSGARGITYFVCSCDGEVNNVLSYALSCTLKCVSLHYIYLSPVMLPYTSFYILVSF